MNNKIKILILLTGLSMQYKAQMYTIDMADNSSNSNIPPQNYLSTGQYYIKDISNFLNNFVGTWEYKNGNEKFQIILTKVIHHHYVETELLNYNYYQDGIKYQYKRYVNNVLVFESPIKNYPSFRTKDGVLLEGSIKDYGRITKNVYLPLTNELMYAGGGPVDANCDIIKVSTNQIKFHLYLRQHFPNYNIEAYAGQPIFSLPNDVTLTKVP
jgi:hypothetical protein